MLRPISMAIHKTEEGQQGQFRLKFDFLPPLPSIGSVLHSVREKVPKLAHVRLLPKLLWLLLALFVLMNALGALRYLLPHVPFPAELDNFRQRRTALSLHAFGGAIALLAGRLQFVPASVKAAGIAIAFWDGSTAAPSCWAGALDWGSRRILRPVGSLLGDFSRSERLGL
jgi:hypothetical protein